MTLQFTSAQTKNLPGILTLQQENLVQNRSLENIQKEGFVTVVHSLHNLKKSVVLILIVLLWMKTIR